MKSGTSKSQKFNFISINLNQSVLIIIGMLIFNTLNAQDIKKHKWENRVLLIHSNDDALLEKQMAILEQSKKELKERKIVIYQFNGDQYKMTDYQNPNNDEFSSISKKKYKNRLKKNDKFKLILVGLDGGKKLKKSEPITISELIDKIDSMPMRRAEIRND